jgi:hypothetical protein
MLGTGRRRRPLTEHSPQIDPGRVIPFRHAALLGATTNPDGPWTTRRPEICRQASAIGPDDSGYSSGIEPASSHAPSTPSQRPHRKPTSFVNSYAVLVDVPAADWM